MYLYSLNNRIFVERSFGNPCCTNVLKLIKESIQIWMNGNSKSFYPRDIFIIQVWMLRSLGAKESSIRGEWY
jgi:hypothetical protein